MSSTSGLTLNDLLTTLKMIERIQKHVASNSGPSTTFKGMIALNPTKVNALSTALCRLVDALRKRLCHLPLALEAHTDYQSAA